MFFVICIIILCLPSFLNALDPDTGLDMVQIATSKGYTSIEKHLVTTDDGYILGVFRIPRGRNETPTTSPQAKRVVFLQHGLLDSSWTWVANFPEESLGFILADNGYDVWFGNSRGNLYSKAHIKFPVDSPDFWNFTWDDMATYDIPAVIPYILQITGQQNLSYIGHSQGTIQALAAFSVNQSIANMVNLAVLLAPVAYVRHASGLLTILADLDVDLLFILFGLQEFLPDDTILQKLAPGICEWVEWGCEDFLFLIVGGSKNLNETRIEVYVSQTPAGTSVKNMAHWSQGIRAEVFQRYDYGSTMANLLHYGQPTPPPYHLEDVKVPCALYYGGKDILADPTDMMTMLADIPKDKIVRSLSQPTFAHLDYTWGYNADAQAMYADVLSQLAKFN